MNNKGQVSNGMTAVIVIGIIIGVVLVLLFLFTLAAPVLTVLLGDVGSTITDAANTIPDVNNSGAASASFGNANKVLDSFEWASYLIIGAMIMGMLVVMYFVRSHPYLIGVWIVIVFVLVFISLFISSAYVDLSTGEDTIATAYQSWEQTNFIFSNLPVIISIIGIVGAILMFAISRSNENEYSGGYAPI